MGALIPPNPFGGSSSSLTTNPFASPPPPAPTGAATPYQVPYAATPIPGSGAVGSGFVPPPAPGVTTSVNTAAPPPELMQVFNAVTSKAGVVDPNQAKAISNIEGRMSADTTARAIQNAQSASQDALAGQIQAAKERAAAGGTSSNIQNQIQALTDQAARNQAAQAAGITLGRERDLDALALGSVGAYGAPSQRELSLLGLGAGAAGDIAGARLGELSQNQATAAAAQAAQVAQQQLAIQAAQQQQNAMLDLYRTLWI